MKAVILTGDDYAHRYVTNSICDAIEVSAIIVDDGVAVVPMVRVKRLFRRYGLIGMLDRFLGRCINLLLRSPAKARSEMKRILGPEHCMAFERDDLVTHINGLKQQKTFDLISRIAPDVIIVYGTSIVPDHILNLASSVAFNLHTGISPFYRGAGCAFWPVYNKEPEYLGATVHECTSRVDGGKIFGTKRSSLNPDDKFESLFPRCVKTGASLYTEVLKKWVNDPTSLVGKAQDTSIGKEYRACMMNWRKEMTVRKLIREGILRKKD